MKVTVRPAKNTITFKHLYTSCTFVYNKDVYRKVAPFRSDKNDVGVVYNAQGISGHLCMRRFEGNELVTPVDINEVIVTEQERECLTRN